MKQGSANNRRLKPVEDTAFIGTRGSIANGPVWFCDSDDYLIRYLIGYGNGIFRLYSNRFCKKYTNIRKLTPSKGP